MLVIRVFTSLYAGLAAIVEGDLKKIVALSTLRHLGFISLAVFSGSVGLAFIHLISHALFKSLLFIAVGEIIRVFSHSQDRRIISSGRLLSGFASRVIVFAIFRLLGFPFLRGFYSKDMVVEMLGYTSLSTVLYVVIYFNIFLTYLYTISVFSACSNYSNLFALYLTNLRGVLISVPMVISGLISVVGVSLFLWSSLQGVMLVVTPFIKVLPGVLLGCVLL